MGASGSWYAVTASSKRDITERCCRTHPAEHHTEVRPCYIPEKQHTPECGNQWECLYHGCCSIASGLQRPAHCGWQPHTNNQPEAAVLLAADTADCCICLPNMRHECLAQLLHVHVLCSDPALEMSCQAVTTTWAMPQGIAACRETDVLPLT